jgi:hypothetical protein
LKFCCAKIVFPQPSPHYSCTLLLQSSIRGCDKPSAGGLVPQTAKIGNHILDI